MSSNIEKKFVTIMFTDIAGYTSQMSKDQDFALSLVDTKQEAFYPLLKKYNGKLVKEMGDGTLSYFSSSIDAAHCSLELQKSLKQNNNLNLRIGIHQGDVLFKNKDVFGDVVNIASRLEAISPAGGVLVSKNVYDTLSIKKKCDAISLGLQSLKGVGRLIEVFGLKGDMVNEPRIENYKNTEVQIHTDDEVPSIAIIPFENKGSKEDEFYSYGISTDLIADITTAGHIRVASKQDISKLKYNSMNNIELSKKLLVRYIATGELWKINKIFQLSIELYDTKKSKIVWSDRWQEDWINLPDIKRNLSDGLLKALDTKSTIEKVRENINTKAYEFYLKAKYRYDKRKSTEETEIARGLLKKAIVLDDNLISAKNLMGTTFREMGLYDKAMKIFISALKQAELLGDKRAMVYSIMCIGIVYNSKGNFNKALEYYNSSLKLCEKLGDEIGMGSNFNNIGNLYQNKGQYNKAIDYFTQSFQIRENLGDKRGMGANLNNIGLIYFSKGSFDKSLEYYNDSLAIYKELNDTLGAGYTFGNMGIVYSDKGDLDKSIEYHTKSHKIFEKLGDKRAMGISLNNIGNVYYYKGEYTKALNDYDSSLMIREELKDKRGMGIILNNIGKVYTQTLEYNKAFKVLNNAIQIQGKIGVVEFESVVLFALINKKLNGTYNKDEVNNFINKTEHIEDYLNYYLFLLLNEKSYIKRAFIQVREKSKVMDNNLKNKFLDYPMPIAIIDQYNKKFKTK